MTTLSELLLPMNRSEVSRRLGAAGITADRSKVNRWAQDVVSPDASEIIALAPILRVDVDELTAIVASDIKRRSAATSPSANGIAV